MARHAPRAARVARGSAAGSFPELLGASAAAPAPLSLRSPPSALTCYVIQVAEVAHLTDAVHPHLHFLLRLGHQIERARCSLDNEHEMVLEFLTKEARARVLPDGALAEVDGADGLAGALAAVVLQDVAVAAQAAPPQHEPAPAPGLRGGKRTRLLRLCQTDEDTARCNSEARGPAGGGVG